MDETPMRSAAPHRHFVRKGMEQTPCGELVDDCASVTAQRKRVTCPECLKYAIARPRQYAIADCKCGAEFVYVVYDRSPTPPLYCAPCESERSAKYYESVARKHRSKKDLQTKRRDAFVAEIKRRGWATEKKR